MGSSVGWTRSIDGRGGGRRESASILSFVDDGYGGGDEATTAQGATVTPLVPSAHSISASTQGKSIFELSRRYVGLALCSSARTVVPVRLGRSLVPAQHAVPVSPASRGRRRKRPVPPPPARICSTDNDGGLPLRASPRNTTVVSVIQRVARRHCFAPAAPAFCGGVDEGGSISRRYPADQNPTPASPGRRSPSPRRAKTGAPGTILEVNANGSQHADSGDGGCSRGRRCGASPTHRRSPSLEWLGVTGGVDMATLLAKNYHKRETYDCPVSPFSTPPCWVDIPPLKVEPPGFSPRQSKSPICETFLKDEETQGLEDDQNDDRGRTGSGVNSGPGEKQRRGTNVEGLEVPIGEHEREGQPETRRRFETLSASVGNDTTTLPPSSSRLEDGTTKARTMTRPVEQTLYQAIASGRRPSYGWGWKRLSGNRIWRQGRIEDPGAAATTTTPPPSSLSSRRERERRWGRRKMTGVLPPTT